MNLKLIDAAIAAYRGQIDEGDAARLAFFRKLWGALDNCLAQTQSSNDASLKLSEYPAPSSEEVRQTALQKRPVLQDYPFEVNAALLALCVEQLVAVLRESEVFPEDATSAIAQISWKDAICVSGVELAGQDPSAWLERLAEQLVESGLEASHAHLAVLLLSLALKVQLEIPAQSVNKAFANLPAEEDRSLMCPVCGSAPTMGHVAQHTGASRDRRLVCPQCSAAWKFDRVRCARCGTRNQGHLHFYHIDDDEAHRIEICDECGGYLRVLYSEDALAVCSYEVEDVVMARLDALALDSRITGEQA